MSDFELLSLVFTVLFGSFSTIGIVATLILNIVSFIQKNNTKKDYPSRKEK